MSKLKTIAVCGALLAALGLSTGALMMAYMNRPVKAPTTVLKPESLDTVAGVKPDAAKGDRVVKLSSAHTGGNASFEWTCGKTGITGARAEDHHGHWDTLGGAVAYNPKAGRLLAVEVRFATDSFQSDNNTLTNTVVSDQHWFDTEKFPEAKFSCADVAPRTPELEKEVAAGKAKPVEGWTHVLKGKFSLNGVEQTLAIPAKVTFTGASAKIEAQFAISRAAFKVEKRSSSLAGAGAAMFTVDDEVTLSARVIASPDIAVLVGELGAQVQAQQAELQLLKENDKKALTEIRNSLIKLESGLEDLKNAAPAAAAPAAPAAPVDLASLPKAFTDEVVLPPVEKDYMAKNPVSGEMEKKHRSYSGIKVPFKMILVPGDPAKGIAPYYIGETEVSWDMFHDWSHWYDTTPTEAQAEVDQKLRPSNADSYADTSHNDKRYDGYPALGMSRLNAEKFCELLSKKTGRHYRLPTEAEWDLAYALGGGDPATDQAKEEVAWCKENAELTPESFEAAPGKIKTKKPNALGLYDMLGNVAEWVKTPGAADADGKGTFVRGGDFTTPVAELSGKLRQESDGRRNVQGSWNANYPNDPTSKWWFKDHYQIGFRLVCDPVNIPKQ